MTAGASEGAGRAAAVVRYRPLDGDAPASRPEWQVLTAPVAASRVLFPRRFARALDRLCADPLARSVPIVHAQRFFGSSLILSVDPNQLVFRVFDQVSDGRKALRLSNRFLDAADWSGILQRVDLSWLHQEMVQLVEYGPRYRKMPFFRRMVRAAQAGRPMARFDAVLDTEEKIHAYFGYYLELIESIRRRGFQPQSVLGGDVPRGAAIRGRNARVEREVEVAIGPDGRLLRFLGGHHRTAIAQALGVRSMPAEVRLVHAGWLRAEAERSGLPPHEALTAWIRRVSV